MFKKIFYEKEQEFTYYKDLIYDNDVPCDVTTIKVDGKEYFVVGFSTKVILYDVNMVEVFFYKTKNFKNLGTVNENILLEISNEKTITTSFKINKNNKWEISQKIHNYDFTCDYTKILKFTPLSDINFILFGLGKFLVCRGNISFHFYDNFDLLNVIDVFIISECTVGVLSNTHNQVVLDSVDCCAHKHISVEKSETDKFINYRRYIKTLDILETKTENLGAFYHNGETFVVNTGFLIHGIGEDSRVINLKCKGIVHSFEFKDENDTFTILYIQNNFKNKKRRKNMKRAYWKFLDKEDIVNNLTFIGSEKEDMIEEEKNNVYFATSGNRIVKVENNTVTLFEIDIKNKKLTELDSFEKGMFSNSNKTIIDVIVNKHTLPFKNSFEETNIFIKNKHKNETTFSFIKITPLNEIILYKYKKKGLILTVLENKDKTMGISGYKSILKYTTQEYIIDDCISFITEIKTCLNKKELSFIYTGISYLYKISIENNIMGVKMYVYKDKLDLNKVLNKKFCFDSNGNIFSYLTNGILYVYDYKEIYLLKLPYKIMRVKSVNNCVRYFVLENKENKELEVSFSISEKTFLVTDFTSQKEQKYTNNGQFSHFWFFNMEVNKKITSEEYELFKEIPDKNAFSKMLLNVKEELNLKTNNNKNIEKYHIQEEKGVSFFINENILKTKDGQDIQKLFLKTIKDINENSIVLSNDNYFVILVKKEGLFDETFSKFYFVLCKKNFINKKIVVLNYTELDEKESVSNILCQQISENRFAVVGSETIYVYDIVFHKMVLSITKKHNLQYKYSIMVVENVLEPDKSDLFDKNNKKCVCLAGYDSFVYFMISNDHISKITEIRMDTVHPIHGFLYKNVPGKMYSLLLYSNNNYIFELDFKAVKNRKNRKKDFSYNPIDIFNANDDVYKFIDGNNILNNDIVKLNEKYKKEMLDEINKKENKSIKAKDTNRNKYMMGERTYEEDLFSIKNTHAAFILKVYGIDLSKYLESFSYDEILCIKALTNRLLIFLTTGSVIVYDRIFK
ncbi:hypothetical protein EHP00_547 [Ecytonucleospora hepatopenaei]|uniref:Uncharacterized protein n=1 Tax=Ecytonucleospora hepatopenaei TaxID=646526 RepID=A0A1W0E8Q8_9MICR|nr:hypothetical protein EHP00_547 [Ecytonucleospora hepatopenaei]